MDTNAILSKILLSEYHLFPFRDKYVFFSNGGKVLLMNAQAKAILEWILENKSLENVPNSIIQAFENAFGAADNSTWTAKPIEWLPTALTVSLTNGCNLRCKYCYASAGSHLVENLKFHIFEKAVNLLITNAKLLGRRKTQINFLGNGESTFNWPLLLECLKEIDRHKNGSTRCVAHLTTNGVVPKNRLAILLEKVDSFTLSVDGLEKHQNFLRPNSAGGSSWTQVMATAKSLFLANAKWEIRMTITDKNVHDLPVIVEFYSKNFAGVPIRLEPMHDCGRSMNSQIKAPQPTVFLASLFEAEVKAKNNGGALSYSGIRLQASDKLASFCGIDTPNFCLKENGAIVACFTGNDEALQYGCFDEKTKSFIVDYKKIAELQRLNINSDKECMACFARDYCLGDCPSLRIANAHGEIAKQYAQGKGRCEINMALVKRIILSSLGLKPTIQDLCERR